MTRERQWLIRAWWAYNTSRAGILERIEAVLIALRIRKIGVDSSR
jgi:hypothetical protein